MMSFLHGFTYITYLFLKYCPFRPYSMKNLRRITEHFIIKIIIGVNVYISL